MTYPGPQVTLEVTWNGQQGELPEPVPWEATELELKGMAWQALAEGRVRGVAADPSVDLEGFVVDWIEEDGMRRIAVRPKTPFGR